MLSTLLLFVACSPETPAVAPGGPLRAHFDGEPASGRLRVEVALRPVARGFDNITDLQFPPGVQDTVAVLQKGGEAVWLDLKTDARRPLLKVAVRTNSELGLLGLAFHPKYAENQKIYVNYNPSSGPLRTVISEWTVDPSTGQAGKERVLLEVPQPYANHDAGQLLFGPDGYLYIGMGDGGSAGDPKGHGQDRSTLLGDLLRIDVDRRAAGLPYAVPQDNPFVGQPGVRPEIWAWGLRNPWRFTFDPKGRLILADVGQNAWEEVNLVSAGDNLGWARMEGRHCYQPPAGCETDGLVEPIFEYGHDLGVSITGGVVAQGTGLPALDGWYVFGDFGSGRLWALDVRGELQPGVDPPAAELGIFAVHPSTFGRDAGGTVYLGDYATGVVYRVESPP